MFALLAAVAPARTQALYLQNGMSEAAIRDHEIQKNSDMIDFCTTTYSSVRNREYCIDVSSAWPRACVPDGAHSCARAHSCAAATMLWACLAAMCWLDVGCRVGGAPVHACVGAGVFWLE
jgi:hypothetical protein